MELLRKQYLSVFRNAGCPQVSVLQSSSPPSTFLHFFSLHSIFFVFAHKSFRCDIQEVYLEVQQPGIPTFHLLFFIPFPFLLPPFLLIIQSSEIRGPWGHDIAYQYYSSKAECLERSSILTISTYINICVYFYRCCPFQTTFNTFSSSIFFFYVNLFLGSRSYI